MVNPPAPVPFSEQFEPRLRPGPTRIDLHYKARARAAERPQAGVPPPLHTHSHTRNPNRKHARTHRRRRGRPRPWLPQTGKTDDWEREAFDYVKYSKIGFFSGVIGVAAIPALFK